MVDMATVQYKVIAATSKNQEYNITGFIENLSWEESRDGTGIL